MVTATDETVDLIKELDVLKEGDLVFYQNQGKKAWLGPERILLNCTDSF